jgi:hypothetical protein
VSDSQTTKIVVAGRLGRTTNIQPSKANASVVMIMVIDFMACKVA